MPREPRMRGVRNPLANRRGFLAFVVKGLEFQTYFDPTTMTTFGLGQSDEPVRIEAYPKGRELYDLRRETGRVDTERRRQRMNLQRQRRLRANPEARAERLRRDMQMKDLDKNEKLYARQRRSRR